MSRPGRPPDIEADIRFLSTDDGGRSGPVLSGYRLTHDFSVDGMLNDAHHEYVGVESVAPGTTARAQLWLLAPEYQAGRLYPGFQFTVQEGPHIVAHGEVVHVLNPTLRATA
jgi:translation elongation factor EF-Tu-like GTPase